MKRKLSLLVMLVFTACMVMGGAAWAAAIDYPVSGSLVAGNEFWVGVSNVNVGGQWINLGGENGRVLHGDAANGISIAFKDFKEGDGIAGTQNTFNIFGGHNQATADTEVHSNTINVDVKGAAQAGIVANVIGGVNAVGPVRDNEVNISGGRRWVDGATPPAGLQIGWGGYIVGGGSTRGSATNNKVNIIDGVVNGAVTGARVVKGDGTENVAATGNVVTILDGEVDGDVTGAIVTNGDAAENKVNINGGVIMNGEITGANVTTGDATGNVVTILDGEVRSNIVGARVATSGKATGNRIIIGGGEILGNIRAAYVQRLADAVSGNSVSVYGDPLISGNIRGGWVSSMGSAAPAGNTLEWGAVDVAVDGVSAFDELKFLLPGDVKDASLGMLVIPWDGFNLQREEYKISMGFLASSGLPEVESTKPALKVGDEIPLVFIGQTISRFPKPSNLNDAVDFTYDGVKYTFALRLAPYDLLPMGGTVLYAKLTQMENTDGRPIGGGGGGGGCDSGFGIFALLGLVPFVLKRKK